ncbi:hypothetical protein SAMN05661010_02504 [Modicisalibacter muralis]|uniref:Uncharacterized protein n=1 Tax=Modicisalibacter muralis TaxID=119000 RepID=A0A1G9MT64_9GAMM|nr:hypothetical protein SAMN05661010_02504 [Halomonas muralis]
MVGPKDRALITLAKMMSHALAGMLGMALFVAGLNANCARCIANLLHGVSGISYIRWGGVCLESR